MRTDASGPAGSGATVLFGQALRLILQLTGTVVLARLLLPSDFGLVAMVAIFMALASLLRDFGVSTLVLHVRQLSTQQLNNLFWVSAGLGLIVSAMLILSAPLIVRLFDEPALLLIAPALAVAVFLDGLQTTFQTRLARRMEYRKLVATDVAAQLFGLVCAISIAAAQPSYWALVLQIVITSLSLLIGRTIVSRWWPGLPRRAEGLRGHLTVSGQLGLAQLLTFAATNADNAVIGVQWGAADLGYYSRAFQLYALPRVGLLEPLTQVAIPSARRALAPGEHPNSYLLRAQFAIGAGLTWVYLCLAVTADWLIPLLLGPQWDDSVPVLQLLAVSGAFAAFGTVSYWMFLLTDQSRQLLWLHMITKPAAVILILLAAPFGIEAVAAAYTAGLVVAWPINLYWLARHCGQDSRAFAAAGGHILAASVVAFFGGTAVALALGPGVPPVVAVLLVGATATVVYWALLASTRGGRTGLYDMYTILRRAVRGNSPA